MAGKRSNGEGTLRKRPNGLWECTMMVGYKDDGTRRYKSFYGKTQKEAKDKMAVYKRDAEAGLYIDPNLTFREWAQRWYDGYRDSVSPTTYESYSYTLKLLMDAFGDRKLCSLKALDVEDFLKGVRASGKSDSLLKISGVRMLTPHSCRHTYVSQLQALGVDMETIQSMVGHADIEMTEHYLHVQEETRQAAAQKFSKAFSVPRR